MPLTYTKAHIEAPKDEYAIHVEVMHGDADQDETVTITTQDPQRVEEILSAMANKPLEGAAGGNESEYRQWCDDTFGEGWIPMDCIYTDHMCSVERVDVFFWDDNGIKHEVELAA